MQIKTIQSILYNKLQLLPLFGNKKFQTTNFIAPTKFELRSRLKLEFKSSRFFCVTHSRNRFRNCNKIDQIWTLKQLK